MKQRRPEVGLSVSGTFMEENLNVWSPVPSYYAMAHRWFTVLFSLLLAVPVCCCGWHSLLSAPAEEVIGCPMCLEAEAATSERGDEHECACSSDLLVRDLAPQAIWLPKPPPSFALLPESLNGWDGRVVTACAWLKAAQRFSVDTGPPRLFLHHHAWLC